MKKTLRCAIAALSAAAVITASTVSASAADCSRILGILKNCGTGLNSGSCGVSITGYGPNCSDISSILKALGFGNVSGSGCSGGNSCGSSAPSTGCGTITGSNDNSCDSGSCTVTPDSKPSKPDTGTSDNSVSEYEKKVVELVNVERAKYGLPALTLNTKLSAVARAKSQDMKDKKYFSHTSPTYGSPFDMMKSFGITYKSAGENIAMGYKTPEAVVNGWMNSAGHRANILSSSFKEIGVGYVASGNYWTQMFIG